MVASFDYYDDHQRLQLQLTTNFSSLSVEAVEGVLTVIAERYRCQAKFLLSIKVCQVVSCFVTWSVLVWCERYSHCTGYMGKRVEHQESFIVKLKKMSN